MTAVTNQHILAIDLGSAFTKVAIRRGWNADSTLTKWASLATEEESYCIPSVVARVNGEWVIGRVAAEQLPGLGVIIHRNWKAALFADSPEAQVAEQRERLATLTLSEAAEVATELLRGIRKILGGTERGAGLLSLPVRVCVPHIGELGHGTAAIGDILRRSGWAPAVASPVMYEPESNALGLISRGRNATWVPPMISFAPWYGRMIDLKGVVGPPLSTMFRAMRGAFGLLVTDVGAFTTDFGYVCFDASFATDDWNRPEIVQHSCKLGVSNLDAAILACLPESTREIVGALRPVEWERSKRLLYRGQPAAVRDPNGGMIIIGEREQGLEINEIVRAFALRVWEAREVFVQKLHPRPLQGEAITGGGTMIPDVRAVLIGKLRLRETRWIYDLLDEEAPRRVAPQGSGYASEREIEKELIQNRELVRGGSAIGACSVFFG